MIEEKILFDFMVKAPNRIPREENPKIRNGEIPYMVVFTPKATLVTKRANLFPLKLDRLGRNMPRHKNSSSTELIIESNNI